MHVISTRVSNPDLYCFSARAQIRHGRRGVKAPHHAISKRQNRRRIATKPPACSAWFFHYVALVTCQLWVFDQSDYICLKHTSKYTNRKIAAAFLLYISEKNKRKIETRREPKSLAILSFLVFVILLHVHQFPQLPHHVFDLVIISVFLGDGADPFTLVDVPQVLGGQWPKQQWTGR